MSFLEGLEPKPRVWYRHVNSGQRAYLVKQNGVQMIRLDRPSEDITKPFDPTQWIPDSETRPMTRAQIAQICKVADRQLCHFLGLAKLAKREWFDMKEKERVEWIEGKGPLDPPARQRLFRVMYDEMEPWTRDGE